LILYTRRFAALIGAGVSLMTCFELLQKTTDDEGVAAANAELSEKVGAGMTLSAAMAERPDVFSPLYIAFVRAGEIGGVMDETFADLADWLEQERDAAENLHARVLLLEIAVRVLPGVPSAEAESRASAAIKEARRVARIAGFCRLFERCLTAGVPLGLAAATAAEVLGEPTADLVRAGVESTGGEEAIAQVLAEVEELKQVVAPMVTTGEEHGCLDLMLRKAAEFLDAEVAHILHAGVPSQL
jgi:type II secretory pathway component PulF